MNADDAVWKVATHDLHQCPRLRLGKWRVAVLDFRRSPVASREITIQVNAVRVKTLVGSHAIRICHRHNHHLSTGKLQWMCDEPFAESFDEWRACRFIAVNRGDNEE